MCITDVDSDGSTFMINVDSDSSKFMVNDSAVEKQYKFSLKSSLQKASKSPLLDGYRVHVTKSVRPEPQQMKGNDSQFEFYCY